MGKGRDSDRDEEIKRLILEGSSTKEICRSQHISPATVSRRRQELKVLAIQDQRKYNRHQEQLTTIAERLLQSVKLPEPAFLDIDDLYARRRQGVEWEVHDGKAFLSIPEEIRECKLDFFGLEVDIYDCFKAHTRNTELWRQFAQWSKRGGEYIRECWGRLTEIEQRVSVRTPQGIPLARKTSEVRNGVMVDLTPQICVLPMFWWTIYSYPLRAGWSGGKVEYKTTGMNEDGICHVAVYCDVDKCSPTPIFRAPGDQLEELIWLHQKLLKDYKLVESLRRKYQDTSPIAESIRKVLSSYVTQESVPNSCLLCADWVKKQRVGGY